MNDFNASGLHYADCGTMGTACPTGEHGLGINLTDVDLMADAYAEGATSDQIMAMIDHLKKVSPEVYRTPEGVEAFILRLQVIVGERRERELGIKIS